MSNTVASVVFTYLNDLIWSKYDVNIMNIGIGMTFTLIMGVCSFDLNPA